VKAFGKVKWRLPIIAALALAPRASAHDQWADGKPIPDWVKASCCGPADAHHLTPEMVHDEGEYYVVDGYHGRIAKMIGLTPNPSIIPSQDGDYWIFYRDDGAAGQSNVYCFFLPVGF
jgi:hypothetical protein